MLGSIATERSRYILPDNPGSGFGEKELRRYYYCSRVPIFLLRLSTRRLVLLVFVSVLVLTSSTLAFIERHGYVKNYPKVMITDVGHSLDQPIEQSAKPPVEPPSELQLQHGPKLPKEPPTEQTPDHPSIPPLQHDKPKDPLERPQDSTKDSLNDPIHENPSQDSTPAEAENSVTEHDTNEKLPSDNKVAPEIPKQPAENTIPKEFERPKPQPMANLPMPTPGDHRLIILLAAEGPSPDLCKVIFSAMANGYPSPIILPWEKRRSGNLARLDKITSALEYLDKMLGPDANENERLLHNDLVILSDPADVWWQLPPNILIQRYFETNRLANERLAVEWGVPGEMPMMQTIVAISQQSCQPSLYRRNLHCDMVPESPARSDLYGNSTNDEKDSLSRPKFLNSGIIMGPAIDIQRLLRQARERRKQAKDHHSPSDQALLGALFGEQEKWRNWLREQPKANLKDPKKPVVEGNFENHEFHIGLDYFQNIFLPIAAEDIHGEFINLGDQAHINTTSKKLGIEPVRLTGVPADIKHSVHPLSKLNITLAKSLDWDSTLLYADYFSQAVPAVIHQNALGEKESNNQHDWWDHTWFFPHLRVLIKNHLRVLKKPPPLAQIRLGNTHATYHHLPAELEKRRPRKFTSTMVSKGFPEMPFEDICEGNPDSPRWFDEIFRDGLGSI